MSSPTRPSICSSVSTSPTTSISSPTTTTITPIPTRRKSRVTAEHTLTRVRENQRRHRARRRDYIHTLEVQLAETELQLEAARREIAALRRQSESIMDIESETRTHITNSASLEPRPQDSSEPDDSHSNAATMLATEQAMDKATNPRRSFPQAATPPPLLDSPQHHDSLPPLLPIGPPPCCTDDPPSTPSSLSINVLLPPVSTSTSTSSPAIPTAATSPECTTCATRPAPSPNESTTLCSQAYMLISQQNFRQIDAGTIRLWLWQGYRRAMRSGEGCRVENGVLLSVLDFISGEL